MSKHYVGIDVHKKLCVYTELDAGGNIVRQGSFGNNLQEVSDFSSYLTPRTHLVLEPVLNYLWLLDEFEAYAGSVHVATPHKVRVIAESKCKTDKYDSRMLAELLRTNFLPESWIPPPGLRLLRGAVRQRYHLVGTMVSFKNRIRYLLMEQGVKLRVSDISSLRAQGQISRLCLPEVTLISIRQCQDAIAGLKVSIKELDDRLEAVIDGIEMISLLSTIPGIGRIWSVTIYAEVGDIRRFRSRKAFASYTGLIPSIRASGESVHYGGITRHGSKPLRHALVEAGIHAARRSPSLRRLYDRVLYRGNVQKARVAVARKLSVIIYAMLKNGEVFRVEHI